MTEGRRLVPETRRGGRAAAPAGVAPELASRGQQREWPHPVGVTEGRTCPGERPLDATLTRLAKPRLQISRQQGDRTLTRERRVDWWSRKQRFASQDLETCRPIP